MFYCVIDLNNFTSQILKSYLLNAALTTCGLKNSRSERASLTQMQIKRWFPTKSRIISIFRFRASSTHVVCKLFAGKLEMNGFMCSEELHEIEYFLCSLNRFECDAFWIVRS